MHGDVILSNAWIQLAVAKTSYNFCVWKLYLGAVLMHAHLNYYRIYSRLKNLLTEECVDK